MTMQAAPTMRGPEGASFSTIWGHEEAVAHLQTAISDGQLSHAYLFEGIPGVGKRTLAYAFARSLFQRDGAEDEHLFLTGNHPDFVCVRSEKEGGSLSKDLVREKVVLDIDKRPYRASRKIYLIEGADRMTPEAQNTLLKTIEEPPAYGLILLTSDKASALLPTILSRVVKITLAPLPASLIEEKLLTRGVSPETARLASVYAGGSPGRALSLCEDEDFTSMRKALYDCLSRLPSMPVSDALSAGTALFDTYKGREDALLDLIGLWIRDLSVLQASGDSTRVLSTDYLPALRTLSTSPGATRTRTDGISTGAGAYTLTALTRLSTLVTDTRKRLNSNVSRDLTLDFLLLGLRDPRRLELL